MVDTTSHAGVFSSVAFGLNRRIDVVGAGAIGSRLVFSLVRLGLISVHVWDFDRVEEHNLANQLYGRSDVGKLKVEALQALIEAQTGVRIFTHPQAVDGSQELGEVVFVATDTMASRWAIWEGLKYDDHTKLMIEFRMGIEQGRVYVVNPNDPTEVHGWEYASDYDDSHALVSACGTTISVGPTAEVLCGHGVWQFINWDNREQENYQGPLVNEIVLDVRSPGLMSRQFK